MGYTVVSHEAVSPAEERPCELRQLSGPAGLSNVAINRFSAEPGEQVPLAYHYHDEQEEAFYVLSGTLVVETPEETYRVPTGSMFAATPGSPHRAYNPDDAESAVELLAIGAPAVSGDANVYEPDADESAADSGATSDDGGD